MKDWKVAAVAAVMAMSIGSKVSAGGCAQVDHRISFCGDMSEWSQMDLEADSGFAIFRNQDGDMVKLIGEEEPNLSPDDVDHVTTVQQKILSAVQESALGWKADFQFDDLVPGGSGGVTTGTFEYILAGQIRLMHSYIISQNHLTQVVTVSQHSAEHLVETHKRALGGLNLNTAKQEEL